MRAGIVLVSIYDNNFLIYRLRIALQSNTRTVLDFFYNEGLYLLGNFPQNNCSYGFNEWDDVWNNPYMNQQDNWNGSMNGNFNGYNGNQSQFSAVMNLQDFSNLTKAIKRDARSDDTKMIRISSATQFLRFSSGQIYDLVKLLNFESSKMKLAKQLFLNCADKQNFYQVYGELNFESSKRELNEYV